ncbi:ShlB/FhaC/HecB family hemolysin secretion/activation protein [Parvularcula sp. LCG005]|nr:ShlB/FhaC/HecB family hemolysin secretion/activation protein [Parvularcula sp. LCG005]WOI54271.1 ShlB/FhaC/HecB family hemolysin secretion/activation protein [Parvularcula sp. LCG005]
MAEIPRQDLTNGKVTVSMSEGYISTIDAEPSAQKVLRRVFRKALQERPLRDETFYSAVAMLDDIPGLTVRKIAPQRVAGDEYVLVVDATMDRFAARALLSNRGSRRDKPYKAFVGGDINSMVTAGDQLSVGYLTRPQAAGELAFVRARYQTAPFSNAARSYLEWAWSNSSPASQLNDRDVDGDLNRVILGVERPLLRRDGVRIDGRASIEYANSAEREDGLTLYEDRLRILQAALSARVKLTSGGIIAAETSVSQGIDIWDAGGQSRPDGDAVFSRVQGDVTFAQPVGSYIARFGASGQRASGPLLFAEEFGVGGGRFGRGYDFGEVMGDHGAAAFVEVARPIQGGDLVRRVEPYLYGDMGATWNDGAGLSADGKTLYSAGAGLRIAIKGGLTLSYEAAAPLSDAPYTLDDRKVRHRIDLGLQH